MSNKLLFYNSNRHKKMRHTKEECPDHHQFEGSALNLPSSLAQTQWLPLAQLQLSERVELPKLLSQHHLRHPNSSRDLYRLKDLCHERGQ